MFSAVLWCETCCIQLECSLRIFWTGSALISWPDSSQRMHCSPYFPLLSLLKSTGFSPSQNRGTPWGIYSCQCSWSSFKNFSTRKEIQHRCWYWIFIFLKTPVVLVGSDTLIYHLVLPHAWILDQVKRLLQKWDQQWFCHPSHKDRTDILYYVGLVNFLFIETF